jgi:hypothetical protein
MERQVEGERRTFQYGKENKIDWGRTVTDYTR